VHQRASYLMICKSGVGYICRVRLLVLAATLLALVVSGCGSGGDDSTTAPAPTGPTSGSDSGATPGGKEPTTAGSGQKAARRAGSKTVEGDSRRNPGGKDVDSKPGKRHSAKVKRKLTKYCPQGTSKEECEGLVEGFLETQDAKSAQVAEPQDCTKAMSRSQCEELLREQQQAAAREGSPVDVQQCMEHPTPECEEALRPVFEQQIAAQQAGE
jgi:hypothetical protein